MFSEQPKMFYPPNAAENFQDIHLDTLHEEPSSHNRTRSTSRLLSSQSNISHVTIQVGSSEYINGSEVSESDMVPRHITRTPSPTPSEIEVLNDKNIFSLIKYLNPKNLFKKERILSLVLISAGFALIILFSIYDKQIVAWFEPAARKIHSLPAGFLIPIAILVVISFPPLFGHELIELLCGLIYGAGIGFAVSACGVLLGEIVNFLTFKYICTKRGKKLEQTNIKYGSFAQIIREGGFVIAIIIRYSAVPDHYATAVFATAGMNMLVFLAAAVLSLPKQFINVYIGSVLALDNEGDESAAQIKKNNLIETVVLVASIAITIIAMRYINAKLNKAKVDVIYKRRKNRQEKLQRAETSVSDSVNTVVEVAAPKDQPPHTILAPIPLSISAQRQIAEDQV